MDERLKNSYCLIYTRHQRYCEIFPINSITSKLIHLLYMPLTLPFQHGDIYVGMCFSLAAVISDIILWFVSLPHIATSTVISVVS